MAVNKQVRGWRGVWRMAGAGLATGAMALAAAGAAGAQPAPGECSPSAMMRTHATTMNQMADYLSAHPEVEQVYADARTRATPEERRSTIQAYKDSHPDVSNAIDDIHRPMVDLHTRCGMPMHRGPGMGPGGPMGPGMGPDGPMAPGMGPGGPMAPGMGPGGPTGPTP